MHFHVYLSGRHMYINVSCLVGLNIRALYTNFTNNFTNTCIQLMVFTLAYTTEENVTVALERLAKDYSISSEQLEHEIEEVDIAYLAQHFDDVELYVKVFGLNSAEQVDVKTTKYRSSNQVAMAECLSLWRKHNPSAATLRTLLEVLLKLRKERIASKVCGHYHPKHKTKD